ncbi:type I-E CRISPR-associated protein Cse1/CasA [Streptomyces hirsutus]
MPEVIATAANKPSFDLTYRSWVPILRLDGSVETLSLRQVFSEAANVSRIVGDLPTQEFSLVRLLLAVAHDALDGPGDIEEWADLWEDPDCCSPVEAYLEQHRDRFDLLTPATPFLQTPGLRTTKDEVFCSTGSWPTCPRVPRSSPRGCRTWSG